jgi:cardiolipin synthase
MNWTDGSWLLLALLELIVIFGFVLDGRRQPAATLAWLMAVAFLPVLGVFLYATFGRQRITRSGRRLRKHKSRVMNAMRLHGVAPGEQLSSTADPRTPPTLTLAKAIRAPLATGGNVSTLLVDAEAAYAAMELAIFGARHHLNVEFYIWNDDATGRRFRDALVTRARDGVEVRVIVDAFGCVGLPSDFFDPLVLAGGKAAFFAPVGGWTKWLRRGRVDFRNHRKILVADGRVGFTGGINIGDEYLGLDPHLGNWRDTHVRIEGPAVLGLQQAFIEDWLWATEDLLREPTTPGAPPFFPTFTSPLPGDDVVLVVDSGPDSQWTPIHRLHVHAIANAHTRVWLTNPYFLPDKVMEEALVTAALRGVDVWVILPERNDSRLVYYASAALFRPLLDAGVRIFRYRGGFVHAKTLLVDKWVATVGSANMDVRSFQLNFELNAFMFSDAFTQDVAAAFLRDLESTVEVTRRDEYKVGYLTRLLRQGASLLSPML